MKTLKSILVYLNNKDINNVFINLKENYLDPQVKNTSKRESGKDFFNSSYFDDPCKFDFFTSDFLDLTWKN